MTADIETPLAEAPIAETSIAEHPAPSIQQATAVAQADVQSPDIAAPDRSPTASAAVATIIEIVQLDAVQIEIVQLEVVQPDVMQPDVMQPDVVQPDVVLLIVTEPVAAPPDVEVAAVVPTAPITNIVAVTPERKNLAEVIVVTSGKGGVGKTTTSASLACGLARYGKKVAVIDFDVGLRNLDLIMGCERRVVYDFVNVINGECNLRQALIKDKRFENLFVLAASQTRDKDALTKEGVEKVLTDLGDDGFEYIVCDSPAGIEKGAFLAMYFADRAVVVVNPEVSSVRDSDRILGLLASKTRRAERGERVKEHLLLTRYSPKRVESGDMLSIKDVQEILGLDVVGVIPEAPEVLQSSNSGEPVILDMNSQAGQAYDDAVARLLGEKRTLRFTTVEKKGFFSKLFGG